METFTKFQILFTLLAALPCHGAEAILAGQDGRFADEPSMARTADGSLYVAWNGFRNGDDALMIARYRHENGQFRVVSTWEAMSGRGTYLLGPKVVAAGNEVFVLYAAERGRAWNIYALPCSEKGPGKTIAVTTGAVSDLKPDGVWHDGTLWVTWDSNRGGAHGIFLAGVRGGRVTAVEAVSAAGASNYEPSIAVESNGRLSVAWHSFRADNYDIWLRQRSARGEWSAERRLTSAPAMDRHPVLTVQKDDLWIFYENAQFRGYRTGNSVDRKIVCAKVTARGLESPRGFAEVARKESKKDGSTQRGEAASPLFDAQGRLWLAYLLPTATDQGWTVWFTGFNGERWAKALAVAAVKGMDRKPSLVMDGETALLAFQFDTMEGRSLSRAKAQEEWHSQVMLASVDVRPLLPAAAKMELMPLVEAPEAFQAGELHQEYGEDKKAPGITYQGKKLKLLFGDLHTHSDISVCARCTNQSVDENYQVRRDLHRLDFACMTDHGYNIVPYLWNYIAKMARANEDPGRMMTFLAQEWTSEFKKLDAQHPYGFYGHRNLILADPFFPRWWNSREGQTPADVWGELKQAKANFVSIPHQLADTGNVPTDWNYVHEKNQPVAEIFQGRGSYEYFEGPRAAPRAVPKPGWFLQDAWARGTVIGVIASPDHAGGLGKACVYAPELTREAILDAIRARHTYGTTAARIFLEMRVNGHLMGDKLPPAGGKPVEVKVKVECPADIERVEICRNNQFVFAKSPEGRTADLTFVDNAPLDGFSYYYVRVTQKDQEMAWSSPVWLGEKK